MKNVVVHGAFKLDNFGDTLLLALMSRHLNSLGYKVYVSGGSALTLKHLSGDVELFDGGIEGMDALIYAGGGYFGEPPGHGRIRWHLHLIRKHLPIGFRFLFAKKRFGCFGTGLGPLSFMPSRWLVSALLRQAHSVVLRDQTSVDALNRYGVPSESITVSADLALLLPGTELFDADESKGGGVALGVTTLLIHPSLAVEEDNAQLTLASDIRSVLREVKGIRVLLMSDQASASQGRARRSWQAFLDLDNSAVHAYQSPSQVCQLIRECDVVVTNKLHVGIVASTYGKIPLAVAKHSKTPRFYAQIERPELCQSRDAYDSDKWRRLLHDALVGAVAPVEVPSRIIDLSRQNLVAVEAMLFEV